MEILILILLILFIIALFILSGVMLFTSIQEFIEDRKHQKKIDQ